MDFTFSGNMSFGNFPFVKVHRIWWEPQVNNVGLSVFLRSETCLKILSIWKGIMTMITEARICQEAIRHTVDQLIGEMLGNSLVKELRSPLLAKRPSSSTKQHQHFESQEQDKAKQELSKRGEEKVALALVHKCIGEMKGRSCIHKTYVGVVVAFAAMRFVLPNVATQHMSLAVWSLGSACTLDRNVLYS